MAIQAVRAHIGQIPRQRLSAGVSIAVAGAVVMALGASGCLKLSRPINAVLLAAGGAAILGGLSCSSFPRRAPPAGLHQRARDWDVGMETIEGRAAAVTWFHGVQGMPLETMLLRADQQAGTYLVQEHRSPVWQSAWRAQAATLLAEQYRANRTPVEAQLALIADVAASESMRNGFTTMGDCPLIGLVFRQIAFVARGDNPEPARREALQVFHDGRWESNPDWAAVRWPVVAHALVNATAGWVESDPTEDCYRVVDFNELFPNREQTPADVERGAAQLAQVLGMLAGRAAVSEQDDRPVRLAQGLASWVDAIQTTAPRIVVTFREALHLALVDLRQTRPRVAQAIEANRSLAECLAGRGL